MKPCSETGGSRRKELAAARLVTHRTTNTDAKANAVNHGELETLFFPIPLSQIEHFNFFRRQGKHKDLLTLTTTG